MKTDLTPARHRHGILANMEATDKRGAALVLEIIIYLVIVALIAVAVISGVRAIRDLVFTSHAKGDIQNVQVWVEGKYTQDNRYPNAAMTTFSDAPAMTEVNGNKNTAAVNSPAGSEDYCINVFSPSISDSKKSNFWILSGNPSKIFQSGTGSNNNTVTAPTGCTAKAPGGTTTP